jgi:hypothetical protein
MCAFLPYRADRERPLRVESSGSLLSSGTGAPGGLQSFDVRAGTANLRQRLSLGRTLETIHIGPCRGGKRVVVPFPVPIKERRSPPAASEFRRDCKSWG